jgi:diguanylate cyclase (GGDEF)-like protein
MSNWNDRLATRIILRIGGILIALSLGVSLLTFVHTRSIALEELYAKGDSLAGTLNFSFETLIDQQSLIGLQRIADNSTSIEDVQKVAIIDLDGNILISSDRSEMAVGHSHSDSVHTFLDGDMNTPVSYVLDQQVVIVHPLRNDEFTARPGDNIAGAVEVVISTARTESAARMAAIQTLGITLGSYLLFSLALGLILNRQVVTPIKRLTKAADQFRRGDYTARSPNGRRDEIGLLANAFNHMADEVTNLIRHLEQRRHELIREIEQRHEVEARLYHQATHDDLTGLPNRSYFLDEISQLIRQQPCTVLFLDFDKFKIVNDSMGHPTGDLLLVEGSRRLAAEIPDNGLLAHFGGDEFLILLSGIHASATGEEVARRIHRALRTPIRLNHQELVITASIGIATSYPNDGIDSIGASDLIRDANIAMYQAKDQGRARTCIYDEAMNADALWRLQTETELRHALEQGAIVPHYQPIVSLESGQLIGFEALARWHHPQRGLLMAGSFISIAEESGLIVNFDWRMLCQACRQVREFLDCANPAGPLLIHVNISVRTFHQPDFVQRVEDILRRSGLPPEHLVLEITETIAMDQTDTTINTLHQLRKIGLQIAVDDFGIGYSSLRYLQHFPVQIIKIDAAFVRTMQQDRSSAAIVETIILLAEALGMDVVAEGIETARQCEQLRKLNCAYGQGKYFSFAVDAASAAAMLASDHVLAEVIPPHTEQHPIR